jgi:divalent metal cation (Fe/Co/Zn/Cd) transporter
MQIRRFTALQYGVAVELAMIGLYRWADVSWLLVPIFVTFACLFVFALALAPRTFVAVFGALLASMACAALLLLLPLQLLINSGSEPNSFSIALVIVWLVIAIIILMFVYVRTERHLIKRLGVGSGKGSRPKL